MGAISVAEVLRRLESFDIVEETRSIVEAHTVALADMNREQLMDGLDSSGKKMDRYKNDAYARKKYQMNSRPGYGIRDQKKTGRFHEGVYAKTTSTAYVLSSSDSKTKLITDRDGEVIFGLTGENKTIFRKNTLRSGLLRAIIRKVRGKIAAPAYA